MAQLHFTWRRGLVLGAGAAATTGMMIASRLTGSPVMPGLQQLAATVAAAPGSAAGSAFGYASQLVNGALFAEGYRLAFAALRITPSWQRGAVMGLGHGVLAGVVLAAVPPLHPRVPEQVPPPGAFMRHHGAGAAAMLVALHVLYGGLVGAAIAGTRQHPSESPSRGMSS
jgi:hypothetical protein